MNSCEYFGSQLPVIVLHLILQDVRSKVFDLKTFFRTQNLQDDSPALLCLCKLIDIALKLLESSLRVGFIGWTLKELFKHFSQFYGLSLHISYLRLYVFKKYYADHGTQ